MNHEQITTSLQEYLSADGPYSEVKIVKSDDPDFLGRIMRDGKLPVNVYMNPDMEFDIIVGGEDITVNVPQPDIEGLSGNLVLAMLSGVFRGIIGGLEECGL